MAGKFERQSTGHWRWDDAKAVVAEWQEVGSWASESDAPKSASTPTIEQSDLSPTRINIAGAVQAFLVRCRSREIKTPTLAKYRTFTNQFTADCTDLGYLYMDQLGVTDMDRFYGSWTDGIRGKAKKLERLKGFVKFCLKRKWLSEDIASDIEAPRLVRGKAQIAV